MTGAAGAPTLCWHEDDRGVQIDSLQEQIDLLIATNDRSPAAMRTLIYLQQLLVTARPEKTQLLANYPNPFNPETWIPYELATDTDVRHHDLQHAGCCDPDVCSLDISLLATTRVGIVRRIGMAGMHLANRLRVVCISISSKPMRCR